MSNILGRHLPFISLIQIFSTGVHWAHWIVAVMPKVRLMVIMTNHTKTLVQPWVIRSNVMAKDVLLQQAARMLAKPAALETSSNDANSSLLIWSLCFPNPMLTDTD